MIESKLHRVKSGYTETVSDGQHSTEDWSLGSMGDLLTHLASGILDSPWLEGANEHFGGVSKEGLFRARYVRCSLVGCFLEQMKVSWGESYSKCLRIDIMCKFH